VKSRKGKGRQMDASYEVLGSASDRDSEGTLSGGEDVDEDVNGEEVRERMDGFVTGQLVRTAISAVAFGMSVVGIWGDGAGDLVVIEM
jgi:autophagy-related protein 33